MKKELVSIIIPAYNAEGIIQLCIESIFNQTYNNFEVIVIDDCSKDNTAEIVSKLGCRLIKNNRNMGAGNAKNLGLKVAKGDYLYFIDSDCILKKDCLEILLKSYSKSNKIGLVGGKCISPKRNSSLLDLAYDVAKRYKDLSNFETYVPYISGSNLCVKREVFDKVGFFNETFDNAEDLDFTFRATKIGYKILFQPRAISYHCHNQKNFVNYLNREFKAGKYGTILRLKYKPFLDLSRFYPNNMFIFYLILPFFIVFSILRIIKKNILKRPIKEIIKTMPILILSQSYWGFGCLNGCILYKKDKDLW